MSEHSVTIVDIDVSLADAPAAAARMLAWLQSEGIVSEGMREGDIYRDWLLSVGSDITSKPGSNLVSEGRIVYRPGAKVHKACDPAAHLGLERNWLEVDVERQVFHAGENGIGVQCASCGADQTQRGKIWGNAIGDWHKGTDGAFRCDACNVLTPLRDWTFDPVWAFGNLGFRFCEWILKPDFIAEFQQRLGHEIRVVYTHL
jgi:hypothetical protein